MNRKMSPIVAAALVAAFAATGIAACGEKPQRVMPDTASADETWHAQLRDRTLKQGESDRMNY
jgi:hypothetical protein